MSTEVKKSNPQAPADRMQQGSADKFEGEVVSIAGNKLVMANSEGKEFSHTMAKDAQVTCDGKPCQAEQLKAGSKVRVTTQEGDRKVATCIEALDKNADFAACE